MEIYANILGYENMLFSNYEFLGLSTRRKRRIEGANFCSENLQRAITADYPDMDHNDEGHKEGEDIDGIKMLALNQLKDTEKAKATVKNEDKTPENDITTVENENDSLLNTAQEPGPTGQTQEVNLKDIIKFMEVRFMESRQANEEMFKVVSKLQGSIETVRRISDHTQSKVADLSLKFEPVMKFCSNEMSEEAQAKRARRNEDEQKDRGLAGLAPAGMKARTPQRNEEGKESMPPPPSPKLERPLTPSQKDNDKFEVLQQQLNQLTSTLAAGGTVRAPPKAFICTAKTWDRLGGRTNFQYCKFESDTVEQLNKHYNEVHPHITQPLTVDNFSDKKYGKAYLMMKNFKRESQRNTEISRRLEKNQQELGQYLNQYPDLANLKE